MAQKEEQILPIFLQVDNATERLKPNETPFKKGTGFDQNGNPSEEAGTQGGTESGYNALVETPIRSNQILSGIPANFYPSGYNKNYGSFFSVETNEFYWANFNGNGNHGLYVVNCDTGQVNTIVIDPNLPFTEEQEGFLMDHRWDIRVALNANKQIVEKFLVYTNGKGWQGFINVNAAIATNGFDAALFPYWQLTPPHFDRRELLEWPTRPPMYSPLVATIANTPALIDQVNRLIDTAFQVAYRFNYTDGRRTAISPYSLPLIIKSEDYLSNPNILPKTAIFTLFAGSCMVESIDIFIRKNTNAVNNIPPETEWSDWYLYDTIYKFSGDATSGSSILGTPYWTRTNPWSDYNYNTNLNQIQYTFDNSNVLQIVDQTDFVRLYNDIPQRSIGMTALGDGSLLVNNRRNYDNLSQSVSNQMSINVAEQPQVGCLVPTRTLRLYAYIGMATDSAWYISQVGFYDGANTQMRFGGLNYGGTGGTPNQAGIDFNISTDFGLNFADKNAFRCYLKGTPYYVDGQWYQVNQDFSLVALPDLLDFSNPDVLQLVRNIYIAGGFFVCVFTFTIPAGRYIATIGRHSVPSAGDFIDSSTYIYGIANSRKISSVNSEINTLRPDAIVVYSKEIEIDCTAGNVDVWGNGHDLFYIYCPYVSTSNFRFIEGYFQESQDSPLGMELYSYQVQIGGNVGADDWGRFTDKNGFYWAYIVESSAGIADVHIVGNINCVQVNFDIRTAQGGTGWKQNPTAYLSDHNAGVVGPCNRVLYSGTITSLDGTIPYSNIAVSIKDGATVLTDENGNFTLIIHNGFPFPRVSNVYVNSGGNFVITIADCGYIPINTYEESLAPCVPCNVRNYPIPLNMMIYIQNTSEQSLKSGGIYVNSVVVGDLAGRLSFMNIISKTPVPSFTERGNTLATYFQWLINGPLNLNQVNPDWKWIAPGVSKNLRESAYTEWVGDYIEYIDNNGNVVSDASSAVYCSISITSLYNYNVARNFSTLATYQFTPGDRVIIMDDGNGNLLTGNPIDLKILGSNYNQAAQTSGLIPSTSTVPIINNNLSNTQSVTTSVTDGSGTTGTTVSIQTVQNQQAITIYVLYDPRLTPLINAKGLWIELWTPADQSAILQFSETQGFYPIINGEVAEFTGYGTNGEPQYEYPTEIDITFWDTYLFQRSITIPTIGDKYFSHPFESPNISDTFGYDLTSGGRLNFNNNLAKQIWIEDEAAKSDNFIINGTLNGIGTFNTANAKRFTDFKSGQINMVIAVRNVVFFLCENDFFVTDYNFQYIYANAQGVAVANLNDTLGSPHQKVGSNYGVRGEDTGTIVVYEDMISWYDRKNQAWVISDYRTAKDISLFNEKLGVTGGMSSYLNSKTRAISNWNMTAPNSSRFDVIGGVDTERGNLYLTFRPRRNNSNDPTSYGSTRENIDLNHQETLVYNTITQRFVRFENFTPEAYGKMKGKTTGIQLVTFAAGVPYLHNTGNQSFNNFYSIQYDWTMIGGFNQNQEVNKVFANLVLDINGPGAYIDFLRTNDPNSFSYVPMNLVRKIENKYYLTLLRNMWTFFPPGTQDAFRSTLIDGKRIYNLYLLFRLVGDPNNRGKYFELKTIYNLVADTVNQKK